MLLTKSPSPKKYIISQMLSKLHFSLLETKICSYMITSTKSSSDMYIFLWGTVRLFSETSCRDRSNTSNQSLIATSKAWVSENSLLKYTRHCFICFFKGEKKNHCFLEGKLFHSILQSRSPYTGDIGRKRIRGSELGAAWIVRPSARPLLPLLGWLP